MDASETVNFEAVHGVKLSISLIHPTHEHELVVIEKINDAELDNTSYISHNM